MLAESVFSGKTNSEDLDKSDQRDYIYVTNYDLGPLSPGTHTLRLDTDTTRVVVESNENDNSYTKTITVTGGGNPTFQLLAAVHTPDGPFQFTLQGINGRVFEVQSSPDLMTWSPHSPTLSLMESNSTHRFYRARTDFP